MKNLRNELMDLIYKSLSNNIKSLYFVCGDHTFEKLGDIPAAYLFKIETLNYNYKELSKFSEDLVDFSAGYGYCKGHYKMYDSLDSYNRGYKIQNMKTKKQVKSDLLNLLKYFKDNIKHKHHLDGFVFILKKMNETFANKITYENQRLVCNLGDCCEREFIDSYLRIIECIKLAEFLLDLIHKEIDRKSIKCYFNRRRNKYELNYITKKLNDEEKFWIEERRGVINFKYSSIGHRKLSFRI